MKRFKNNNSGFTLVELIIAMAVLAFLMTAVGTLMGSSVASHRKQKAEIRVHTAAQQAYNQISDSIMQAKEVVVFGYEVDTAYDFAKPGVDVGATPNLVCYVKSDEMKTFVKTDPTVYLASDISSLTDDNIRLFSEFDNSKTFYVKQIGIMTSVPLDIAQVPSGLIKENTTDHYKIQNMLSSGGTEEVTIKKDRTASGTDVLGGNDNVINIYTFEANNMYYQKKYGFMTTQNDTWTMGGKDKCIYNQGLSYVKTSGTGAYDISAVELTVDADNGAIGIELQFNDKNMTYTTQGMVNIRNSYVLKGKDN